MAEAGNSFSRRAPALMAANASLGVSIPGITSSLWPTPRAITSGSVFGVTISRAPVRASRSTLATSSTVPAPISASCPNAACIAAMLSNGSGEFSGTSIIRTPPAMLAAVPATASSGFSPRNIATIGGAPAASILSNSPIEQLQSALHASIPIHAADRHAMGRQRALIDIGKGRRADQHHRSRQGRIAARFLDLGADQQAGEIAARPAKAASAQQLAGTGGKQAAQHAVTGPRRLNPFGPAQLFVLNSAGSGLCLHEARLIDQQGKQLARQER